MDPDPIVFEQQPCPGCGHIDWEFTYEGDQAQPFAYCWNCGYSAYDGEEVVRPVYRMQRYSHDTQSWEDVCSTASDAA